MKFFEEKMSILGKVLQYDIKQEGNAAAFQIDDLPYDFYYEEETQNLIVYSCLAELPSQLELEKRMPILAAVYQRLLQAQYCFSDCGGFSFGVDQEATMVNLQTMIPLAKVSDEEFIQHIEKFVQFSNLWTSRLTNLLEKYSADSTADIDEFSQFSDLSDVFIRG